MALTGLAGLAGASIKQFANKSQGGNSKLHLNFNKDITLTEKFLPKKGISKEVLGLKPGAPAFLQALAPGTDHGPSCLFTYGTLMEHDLADKSFLQGSEITVGWVYGAKLGSGPFAVHTGHAEDIVKGKMLCWPSATFKHKIVDSDTYKFQPGVFVRYTTSADLNQPTVKREIVSVVHEDGEVTDAWAYVEDTREAHSMSTKGKYMPEGFSLNYTPLLSKRDTQIAIHKIKAFFEEKFAKEFNLFKHVAPFAFPTGYGINDDLDGSKRHAPLKFHVANLRTQRGVAVDEISLREDFGFNAEIVESLAKWKRTMLKRYDCKVGEGLFCDSTSIRQGYFGDATHSNICDQWDWEVTVTRADRNVDFLKKTVKRIWKVLKQTEAYIQQAYPQLRTDDPLPQELTFISAEDLHKRFPDQGIHERENSGVREFGAIFVVGMGWKMKDGSEPEEIRAPDYDDWELNGDIIVKHPITGYRHELSSMGIRVDAASLRAQLKERKMEDRLSLPFHKAVLEDKLPLSMGGGIGISRLMMLLLKTAHIGEVQAGIWHPAHIAEARAANIDLIPTY
eukprot:gb/GEZN01003453.1/.p1 GENE.gb/GEZN01003453.1/~~gb/GEZN01003453.1/.p1  ORF type:complete len:607 (-),score=80.10 gb/GEZN01003453.1/:354-2045(-)